MKSLVGSILLLLAGTHIANADAPRVAFSGLDTAAPIDANLDALNDVSRAESPNFDEYWTGTTPDGLGVMLGLRGGDLALFSASKRGHFGPNDRADISAMEKDWGLEGLERTVSGCGERAKDIDCTAVFYACPDSPPLCHITVFSFGSSPESGRIRFSWEREPKDLTVRP
jgi:hypothetical protein